MRGKEEETHTAWETARYLAYNETIISPFVPTARKPKNIRAFDRFPWEKEEKQQHESVVLTEAQVEELFKLVKIDPNKKS